MQKVMPEQMIDIYQAAFNQVCDPADWKNPIDALIPATQFRLYIDAVNFMTGTEVEVLERDENGRRMYHMDIAKASFQMFRIKSIGYRAGPCGG